MKEPVSNLGPSEFEEGMSTTQLFHLAPTEETIDENKIEAEGFVGMHH
jgi:hypothetical protein